MMSETGEKPVGYPGTFPGAAPSYGHAQPLLPPGSAPAAPPYYPPSGQVVQDMNHTGEKAGYPVNFPGGALSYAYAQPSVGFQQPIQPPVSAHPTGPPYNHPFGQAVPGFAVAQVPLRTEDPLPCCGLGLGWFLFILGFFVGIIPWFVGAVMLCCVQGIDKRERPGYIACAIAAVIGAIILVLIIVLVHQAAQQAQ